MIPRFFFGPPTGSACRCFINCWSGLGMDCYILHKQALHRSCSTASYSGESSLSRGRSVPWREGNATGSREVYNFGLYILRPWRIPDVFSAKLCALWPPGRSPAATVAESLRAFITRLFSWQVSGSPPGNQPLNQNKSNQEESSPLTCLVGGPFGKEADRETKHRR